jgi:hypothetical protein
MPDMLVNLRNLSEAPVSDVVEVRRANAWDKRHLKDWVTRHFGASWADCCEAALEQRPITCFVVVEKATASKPNDLILGFACYDIVARGVFGPMGIQTHDRKQGLGSALVLTTLRAMRDEGYAYGIIGQVGPAEFYTKVVGATVIAGSDPGTARTFLTTER